MDFENNGLPDRPPTSFIFFDLRLAILSIVVFDIIKPVIFWLSATLIIVSKLVSSISGAIFKKIGNSKLLILELKIPTLTAFITFFKFLVSWKSLKFGVLGDDIFIVI